MPWHCTAYATEPTSHPDNARASLSMMDAETEGELDKWDQVPFYTFGMLKCIIQQVARKTAQVRGNPELRLLNDSSKT